jgi:dTDP-4-amino-4,6-dideoxygalactose transaminase
MSRDAWRRYQQNGPALYDVVMAGFKYNMMDVQAAIGLRQLARIGDMLARRQALWARYDEGLADLKLVLPAPVPGSEVHARHLYTVLVDPARCGWTRNQLAEALAAEGVQTSVHFTALHLFSYFQERFGLRRGMFPNAEYVSDCTLSLPLSVAMSDRDVDHVVSTVARLVRR